MLLLHDDVNHEQGKRDCGWQKEEPAGASSASHTQSIFPGDSTDFFQCEECIEIFTCKNKLYEHALAIFVMTPYECVECKRKFQFKNYLKTQALLL